MGISSSSSSLPTTTSTSIHKGVSYNAKKDVIDCLFCRITTGKEPNGAPLWYKDDKVAVFVPRTPAAALHFLVVPLDHRQNSSTLIPADIPLLDHMTRVAKQMLHIHGKHLPDIGTLPRCASPPLSYTYPTNALVLATDVENQLASSSSSSSSSSSDYMIDTVPISPNWRLDYHLAPYNSIDHLHLHALYLPFRSVWDRMTFWPYGSWTGEPDYVRQLVLQRGGTMVNSNQSISSAMNDGDIARNIGPKL